MEAQLGAELNSIDVLRAEIAREENILSKKSRRLGELRKNAKAAENQRKRQRRASHPVLRELEKQGTGKGADTAVNGRDLACVKVSDETNNNGLYDVSERDMALYRYLQEVWVVKLTARADGTGRGHAGGDWPAAAACRGHAAKRRPGGRPEGGCCAK